MDLQKLIDKNIKNIPFEGEEIDREGMEETIKSLLKGMITFAKDFKNMPQGYFRDFEKDGKYYSREEIVNMFLNEK